MPIADKFQTWVVEIALPSIRKRAAISRAEDGGPFLFPASLDDDSYTLVCEV